METQNSDEFRLVPYVLHEGQWTLPDHFLRLLVQEFKAEKTFDQVFFEGAVKTADEFVQLMQNPSNVPVFLFRGKECLGCAWLNGSAGNMAFAHFCFKKHAWGKWTLHMGRMLMDYWFSFPGEDEPLFEFIFGLMPGFNKAATKYVERLGWKYLGSVPKMMKCEYRADRASAEIYYISRFDYVEKEPQAASQSGS